MAKKLFIDLNLLRNLGSCKVEAIDKTEVRESFKTLRERATFRYTCRRCMDAPCISACPVEALEKDHEGIIQRALNLCIRCKSCVVACPFGTIMNDLFQTRTGGYQYFDVSNEEEMEEFASHYPGDVARVVDSTADLGHEVYPLNDRVLVKDFIWNKTGTNKQ